LRSSAAYCGAFADKVDSVIVRCLAQSSGDGAMRVLAAIVFLVTLAGWTDTRGMVWVQPAAPGSPYDFVVHVRNIPDIGYNPEVKEDRYRMALKLLRGQCRTAHVVGDDKIITEIWGITCSPPDYVVLVRCV
jgi:hypothetical protein